MSDSVRPHRWLPHPWDSPGKNTGVGCPAFLQGIFLTQRSNPSPLSLLHCRQILYCWATGESPTQTCTFPHYISFKILLLWVKVKMKSKKVIVNLVYIMIYNREHVFGLQRQLSRNFWVSQSINIYPLGTCYVSDTVRGMTDSAVNKVNRVLNFRKLTFWWKPTNTYIRQFRPW